MAQVNIYGSRELFVNEYRLMLADKLLQNLEYETDRDVQTLELLKLRFGEDSLQQCEIMVRDIEDSKRLNANIASSLPPHPQVTGASAAPPLPERIPIDATIVSEEFWPPFQKDEFAPHPRVERDIKEFQKAYNVLRNPRSLRWHASLGTVQVSVLMATLEGRYPCVTEGIANVRVLSATAVDRSAGRGARVHRVSAAGVHHHAL